MSLYRLCLLGSLSTGEILLSVLLSRHSRRNVTLWDLQNHLWGWSLFTFMFSDENRDNMGFLKLGSYSHCIAQSKWHKNGVWSLALWLVWQYCRYFGFVFKHHWEAGKYLQYHVKSIEKYRAIFIKGLKDSSITCSICILPWSHRMQFWAFLSLPISRSAPWPQVSMFLQQTFWGAKAFFCQCPQSSELLCTRLPSKSNLLCYKDMSVAVNPMICSVETLRVFWHQNISLLKQVSDTDKQE